MLAIAKRRAIVDEPTIVKALFGDARLSWIWLLLRLYVGYSWLEAGWEKIEGKGWIDGGASLQAYWTRSIAIPATGKAPITYDWYRDFLTALLNGGHYTWFAPLVAFGEFAVGLGLIVGAFVGVAAFFGALMNWSFGMAGSASTNPMLFALAIFLIIAWKTAGYIGVDRVLLPLLGTPWRPGVLFMRGEPATKAKETA